MGRALQFLCVFLLFLGGLSLAQAGDDPFYEAALEHYRNNRLGEAHTMVRRALERNPLCAACRYLYGLTFVAFRQYPSAEAQFQQALLLDPSNQRLRLDLAIVLMKQGKIDLAAQALAKLVEQDPAGLTARLYLGRLEMERGQLEAAKRQLEAVLERDPRFPAAHLWLSRILLQEGRKDEAIQELNHELRNNSRSEEAQLELAALLLDTDQPSAGLNWLLRARSLAPGNAEVHFLLAKTYRALGRLNQAIQSAQRSLEIRPQAEVHLLLAELYRQAGNTEQAEEELKRYEEMKASGSR